MSDMKRRDFITLLGGASRGRSERARFPPACIPQADRYLSTCKTTTAPAEV